MANRLIKSPSVRVTPGVPGRSATPAYCVDEPVYVDYGSAMQFQTALSLSQMIRGRKSTVIDPSITQMFTGFAIGSGVYVGYILRTCYPAKPAIAAIPPKFSYDAQPGWNSGGVSVGAFSGDGYFECVIGPSSIAVIVGISSQSDTLSPSDCSHAFYGHQGLLDIIENGAIVASVVTGLAGRPVLTIARAGSVVRYLVNGVVVHTSAKPSHGYARLDASLYMAGDYIDDPRFASYSAGAASGSVGVTAFIDPRPRATGRVGVSGFAQGRAGDRQYSAASTAVGINTLPVAGLGEHHASAVGEVGVQATATPPANSSHGVYRGAIGVASDRAYAFSSGVYRGGYVGDSLGGFPEVDFSFAAGYAPVPVGFAFGLSGGVAQSHGVGPAFQGAAGESGYAFVRSTYRGGYHGLSYAPWLDPASILLREPVLLDDTMHMAADVYATFLSVVQVGSSLALEMELSDGMEWFESILINSVMAENGDRFAEFSDQVAITTQTNIPSLEGIQYATNINTGAITRYSGFDFMAIASTPYGSIGVRHDGVYRIGQGGDDGEGIDLMVDFGASQYGTNQSKLLESVYFGLATDGEVMAVLKADDGQERAYKVVNREPMMRITPAKGVKGNKWRLCLKVYEATQAELDSVELLVGVSTRRITGGRR